MNPPDLIDLSSNQLHIDDSLKRHNLFSARVTNALIRQGIITPRILLMHTMELLLRTTKNLGSIGLAQIEYVLAKQGWNLAETADEKQVMLTRLLAGAFDKVTHPLPLSDLIQKVNHYSRITWDESEVAEAAASHPYIEQIESGRYQFHLHSVDALIHLTSEKSLPDPVQNMATEQGKVLLSKLWPVWLAALNERQQKTLFLCYGIQGEDPLTLQEVGEELNLTRERIRQINYKGRQKLIGSVKYPYWQPMQQLLSGGIRQADNLLTPNQWEGWLDENTIWEGDEPRPSLLQFMCAIFDEFHYLDRYHVATIAKITSEHLKELNRTLKLILRQHGKTGLTADELISETQCQQPANIPSDVGEPAFILKAIDLFERIGLGVDGRYYYLKKKTKTLYPTASSGWPGKPETRLYDLELRLRKQFEKIAWIGQIRLAEDDFMTMCQVIQEEAQVPNYFSKEIEGQPRLAPPAVFMTTMVLSARYSEQTSDDTADEFWHPYLRTVWGIEYSQAFYARCKKRFNAVASFLEETYGFEFPRLGKAHGDVITPIFRHALIPRYMQSDFAKWLCKNWRSILSVADTPASLAAHLREDHSLDHYYSHRLKHFITGTTTAETAATLISTMAVAISLHVIDGESVNSISDLLADTPIEQELWHEIAKEFVQQKDDRSTSPRISKPHVTWIRALDNDGELVDSSSDLVADTPIEQELWHEIDKEFVQQKDDGLTSLRISKPRVTWIWSLDNTEMLLRVQNIILPADNNLDGEPDRLVWLNSTNADPLTADIEVEVSPWRMKTGERIIQEILLAEPDGPKTGILALLTDMDEVAMRLEIPSFPTSDVQFFRSTQQGAYGVPVDFSQVGDGVWFVCSEESLTFLDEDNEIIDPDTQLIVPYPLDTKYKWAAQYTLSLPVTIRQGNKEIAALTQQSSQSAISAPLLVGSKPIVGLSRHIQPTFSDTHVKLVIEYDGERLLKQASLWIQGKDGQRWQRTLADLYQHGHVALNGESLHLNFSQLLPLAPNIYAVELRISLQPIFSPPIQFGVVPGLALELPPMDQLYTPANPFALTLHGLDESIVVHSEYMSINTIQDGSHKVIWHDLRNDPYLLLRFDKVDIPLAWSISRFMTWLEPTPSKVFLTLDELRQTSLHAVSANSEIDSFFLFIHGQGGRSFPLKRGRYSAQISQTQLYDMVRLTENQNTEINAQIGAHTWRLFEVRHRPQLTFAQVEYDQRERTVLFHSGLEHNWTGNGRFVVESLTNPFAPLTELAKFTRLQNLHILPVLLSTGVYLLRLELDGTWLLLHENQIRFTVGERSDDLAQAQQLVDEIRKGQIISPELAEDFVLWWAEIAELEKAELTATTLFQLATIPASVLEHFAPNHLKRLWPTLAALKAVNNVPVWVEQHGLLPAWILLANSVILKTTDRSFPLLVYPIQVLQGGLRGSGYGRWHLTMLEGDPKESVYVQWRPFSGTQVIVEAGLPERTPRDWSKIELEDTYALYHCSRCGRLTGARGSFTLPKQLMAAHLHGRETAELRDITQPEERGGYRLLADFFFDRRGQSLTNLYDEFGITYLPAAAYMPEPPLTTQNLLDQSAFRSKFVILIREILRYGTNSADTSAWACAARLLNSWGIDNSVSQLGQSVLAFGLLIRSAAYNQRQFQKLCKDANLSASDVRILLAELNKTSAAHLNWGITWAELLFLHGPPQVREGNNE